MSALLKLPESYEESFHIDLQKDKKLAILVNAISLIIFVPIIIIGNFISPISHFFNDGILSLILFVAGCAVYIILHELVHGIFMRIFSKVRPNYGFTSLYAYAGSDAYFDKTHYIIIALAPVVIWGIVLAALCVITNGTRWFWIMYLIEGMNLSGAAGDLYVTWRFLKLPRDILIQDSGIAMTVYTRK